MAHLFKDKIIRAELEHYNIPDLENKISRVKTWYEAYKNKSLQTKTESQCEQAFNQHFFVEILGYSTFPNESYTIDPKGTADASGQKADASLGYFSSEKHRVTAVVEIKDVNTSLDKSQQRAGNLSPIQQAFKYKPQYKDCAFVIATNFYEIRLFRDNQLDYESFTLESLVDPESNYYNFRKFYYLLNSENFVIKHGKSNTEKLLSEIRVEQEKITKEFYKDYKDLRQSLINNIQKNNTNNYNFDTVIEKAQKVIDRIVFICFCEDKELIPENKLQEVVFHTEKLGLTIPVWDIIKGFFKAIDSGSPKLGIPDGYNGELFKEDPILNNMLIDDAICKRFVDLGKYDFSEDLSVNILGHIFEQSITDLEELKSFAEQKEMDKKKSKRKKEGIFYTPDYIVDYIVKNSLVTYLEEKEKEILKKHDLKEDINEKNYTKRALKAYQEYQELVRNIKVLDPACGSGAFLVKVFDYLLAENKRVADILTELSGGKKDLFSSEDYIKNLLENNIFGVDLNPESVEITKLSLWLKTAIKGKKLMSLKGNIKCGNSIIDDPTISNRAFKWEEEFSEIIKNGGFDVVVGNPPYVRQELLTPYKPYLQKKYKCYSGTTDLFAYFYERALNLLKTNGIMSFISNSFAKTSGAGEVLRGYLQNNAKFVQLVDFGTLQIFEGATTYPMIFVLRKNSDTKKFKYLSVEADDLNSIDNAFIRKAITVDQANLNPNSWIFESKLVQEIRNKISKYPTIKEKFGKCYRGILTGLNEAFVLSEDDRKMLLTKDPNSKDVIKSLLEGKDIAEWTSLPSEKWLIFTKHGTDIEKYPAIKEWLEKYREKLTPKTSDNQQLGRKPGKYQWFEIQDSVDYYQKFESTKIIWPNLQSSNKFCWDSEGYYINAPAVILPTNEKWLLAILNSKLAWFFLKGKCVIRSGGFLEVKPQYFQQIPIPEIDNEQKHFLEEKVDITIQLHKQITEAITRFQTIIKQDFKIEKWPQKLKGFWKLLFEEFLKNLVIKTSKISLDKKEELLKFFEKNSKELKELELKTAQIDSEINDSIFSLYGLADVEKTIIEQE